MHGLTSTPAEVGLTYHNTTLPTRGTCTYYNESQVRKRERNYTVIGLGYTTGPENPCKPRHYKNPAVSTDSRHYLDKHTSYRMLH
ncbi:hypothetical protein Taro_052890 [Colocasia esculenta]|uniref:Uncharacterized protein n=1 Tax=Colocasia esculenta TaxID=4460 RepID=A0A843XLJ0_COLES|nr:hypothetical protein [Colocasia esculenta]